jgi:hypothetical protein
MQDDIEVFGTAELIVGGYLFRSDANPRKAIAIDYRNVNLMLFGIVAIADQKWAEDCSSGDLARLLGRVA